MSTPLANWVRAERGRARRIAEALRLSNPTNPVLVYQWASGLRPVPLDRVMPIVSATGNDLMPWDLRDDWMTHWPHLAGDSRAPSKVAA